MYLYFVQDLQEVNLLDLIHKSLELKQKYNTEYLKKIVSYNDTDHVVRLHEVICHVLLGQSSSYRTNRISFFGYNW